MTANGSSSVYAWEYQLFDQYESFTERDSAPRQILGEMFAQSPNLEISDDGPGSAPGSASTGVGTAVIDSWLSILKGVKTIETAQGHGCRLTVSFTS